MNQTSKHNFQNDQTHFQLFILYKYEWGPSQLQIKKNPIEFSINDLLKTFLFSYTTLKTNFQIHFK